MLVIVPPKRRAIHYLSFGAFALITAHGFFSGTDSKLFVLQAMYAISVVTVAGLTVYRVIAARASRRLRALV